MRGFTSYQTHTLHNWSVLIFTLAAALGTAAYCLNALAQSCAGFIQGTVTDSTGTVIAGAAIHVVDLATNDPALSFAS